MVVSGWLDVVGACAPWLLIIGFSILAGEGRSVGGVYPAAYPNSVIFGFGIPNTRFIAAVENLFNLLGSYSNLLELRVRDEEGVVNHDACCFEV